MKNKIPHKCPVCQGKGIVILGFYNLLPTQTDTKTFTVMSFENCRSCTNGIIWGEIVEEKDEL